MSRTSCPGDATYALLATDIPNRVTEIRSDARRRHDALIAAATTTTTAEPDVSIVTPSSTTPAPPLSTEDEALAQNGGADRGDDLGDGLLSPFTIFLGAAATFGAVLLAGATRFRRRVG